MCTSLKPDVLSRERELLDHYHGELSRGLEARFGKPPPPPSRRSPGEGGDEAQMDPDADGGDGAEWYPAEQFADDYRVAFLDYMR